MDSGKEHLVLVVDDDEALREMMVMMVKMGGYAEVLESEGCDTALRVAERWKDRISLIIIDMMMPTCSGAECAQSLHERYPASKFLLISGDRSNLHEPLEMLGRCARSLPKPFSFKEFSNQVETLLNVELGSGVT
jgi:DNA-binding NtrC family response regulator